MGPKKKGKKEKAQKDKKGPKVPQVYKPKQSTLCIITLKVLVTIIHSSGLVDVYKSLLYFLCKVII